MKAENIRSIALLIYYGSVMPPTAAALLLTTKKIGRLGKVENSNTVARYDPKEH